VISRFDPKMPPTDAQLRNAIEAALAEPAVR
jgi:hypothetical protein